MDKSSHKLSPHQLYRHTPAAKFNFKDTSELSPQLTILGQDRGTTAIEFSIEMDMPNYNLFVLGPSGSGRLTAVQQFIDDRVNDAPTPDDWCYVYNPQHPHQPKAIRLPAGHGSQFRQDMETLINTLRSELANIFESDAYTRAHNKITEEFQQENQAILEPTRKLADEKSFVLQPTPQGALLILPVRDNEPLTPDVFASLPDEEKEQINQNRKELEGAIAKAFQASQDIQSRAQDALEDLRCNTATQVITSHMAQVLKKYDLSGAVIQYLRDVQEDILNHLDAFQQIEEETPVAALPGMPTLPGHTGTANIDTHYKVNILVEHEPDSGAPVVLLDLPTYQNLVGWIEHEFHFGVLSTDFTQIQCGALHKANGGYLIIRAIDILQHPFAWEALERALIQNQIRIEDPDTRIPNIRTTQQLQPEPIPLKLKVVLVGNAQIYYLLYNQDERFRELFRVKADFVYTMARTEANEIAYAHFITARCREEALPHFDVAAVRRIVDYGSWLVSDQEKLSTRFGEITPLLYESAFFARRHEHSTVQVEDVEEALAASIYRNNQLEYLSQQRIEEGIIFIDVTDEIVGQVNGLVVLNQGDHSFGLASRLTARVYMGRKDVVQIDRESNLTGPIHDKGVLILQGYLGGHYAQNYPLTLTATLTFEQNYGGVEGDSASSTELYALLSALSGFPIKQELAVTGSVNQLGKVQPIGGATQKIEGFYQICKARGLTGTQGCIIPAPNVRHLVLNDEIVQAVENELFHVYAVDTIDEGIALLTGKPADEVHAAVDARLRYLAETLAEFENRRTL